MLIGDTCSLRHLLETDLDDYIRLQSDARSRGGFFPAKMTSPEVVKKEFAETRFVTPEFERMAIVDHEGRIKGDIVHFKGRMLFTREIGFWLYDEADRGKGIVTEAVRILSDYLFRSTYQIHRLEILMATANVGSERVAQKAGFQKDGELRDYLFMNGTYWNCYMYSRLRTEWTAPAKPSN